MEVHVGCSGWFYSHWRGLFYPPGEVGTKMWFAYYANLFRTVEINASFYRWPKPATVRRWRREAPPGFIYSVKAHRSLTHERRFVGTAKRVAEFYELVAALDEHLGCVLFQFPPSFHFGVGRLRAITRQLAGRTRTAVEFRHKSWWRPDVYRALADSGLAFCAVSAPRLPEDLPAGVPFVYARLHGRSRWYRHDYSEAELTAWAGRIAASGVREAWVYFDNDRQAHAVKNALRFRKMVPSAARGELRIASPLPSRLGSAPS